MVKVTLQGIQPCDIHALMAKYRFNPSAKYKLHRLPHRHIYISLCLIEAMPCQLIICIDEMRFPSFM